MGYITDHFVILKTLEVIFYIFLIENTHTLRPMRGHICHIRKNHEGKKLKIFFFKILRILLQKIFFLQPFVGLEGLKEIFFILDNK